MKLSDSRTGEALKIKGRNISFSFHPTVQRGRRYGLQPRVFIADPWRSIKSSIQENCPRRLVDQASAFIEQAEDFYLSAQSSNAIASKPLLLYYAFLNLGKAFVLHTGTRTTEYEKAFHGLTEGLPLEGREFYDSTLKLLPSSNSRANIFPDFGRALTGRAMTRKTFELPHLRAQLLHGHRLWCDAENKSERFIEINNLQFMHSKSRKEVWLNLELFADDLSRFSISRKRLLSESSLGSIFHEVRSEKTEDGRRLLLFEQRQSTTYSGRPSDNLHTLVNLVKPRLWVTIMPIPPFWKYYLYLCPPSEATTLLPQLLSIWSVFYYLGSVTRYKPNYFDEIVASKYGAYIQEVISNVPHQFIFGIASEFAKREVAQAPIV